MGYDFTVNMDNLSDEEREQLLKLIKKAKKKAWKPQKTEEYFYISTDDDLAWAKSFEDVPFDRNQYAFGNCFKTREEAEFIAEKLKVIAKLKRFADCNSCGNLKYVLVYSLTLNCILVCSENFHKRNDVYFSTEEIAEKAIKAIGEDRLKKYYFGIE